MVNKKLQKKWEEEAEKYEDREVFKVFSGYYSPAAIEPFFLATRKEVESILGKGANKTKVLGLFTEAWRLAIKKSLPPCCENDFLALLSEARIVWERKRYKGAYLKTLCKIWRKNE
jgi:hypothetical protein